MDMPHSKFQSAKMGGGGPPQFHNIMYPSKQGLLTNIFVNHPFQRTFASVVSCGNPTLNFRQSTSKLVNSFLEAVIKQDPQQQEQQQQQATTQSMVTNREFNDFKKMPNWRSMEYQQKYSKKGCVNSNSSNNRYRPPNKRFQYFHHHPHQHHDTSYHHNYFQKNRHEKERFSIERDIRNDRCDISNRFASRGKPNNYQQQNNNNNNNFSRNIKNNNNNVGLKSSTCPTSTAKTTESIKSPPFEIYSLEEFPAIVATTLSSMCNSRGQSTISQSDKNKSLPKKKRQDVDEHDFVKFQSNIALTTPTYVQPPIRFNLCEAVTKIVTSPKKLLSLPLNAPKRSCLKATPLKARSMSECSDDFIVFDYTNTNGSPYLSHDKMENESDGDDDDDDEDVEEEEEDDDGCESSSSDEDDEMMDEGEEEVECDKNGYFKNDNLRTNDYIQQPDSGIEEKKVHFNAAVKVNVIRAWDYAYRAARRGDEWLQAARDRERFKNRIKDCENVLRPILNNDHRIKVFAERFETS